jgi:hypothetical protein
MTNVISHDGRHLASLRRRFKVMAALRRRKLLQRGALVTDWRCEQSC